MALPLQIRPRDFCWASEGDVVPLTEYLDELRVSFTAQSKVYMNHPRHMYNLLYSREGADPVPYHATFAWPAHLGY